MTTRGASTWCPDCTAPELGPREADLARFFLDALPAYVSGQGGTGGFDRAQVLALMDLRAVPPAERADTWDILTAMEGELRAVLAQQQALDDARRAAERDRSARAARPGAGARRG